MPAVFDRPVAKKRVASDNGSWPARACCVHAIATPPCLQTGSCVIFDASAVEISEGKRVPEDFILLEVSTQ